MYKNCLSKIYCDKSIYNKITLIQIKEIIIMKKIIVNEVLGLFISNSAGIILLKCYIFSNGCSFDILSG